MRIGKAVLPFFADLTLGWGPHNHSIPLDEAPPGNENRHVDRQEIERDFQRYMGRWGLCFPAADGDTVKGKVEQENYGIYGGMEAEGYVDGQGGDEEKGDQPAE